MPMQPPAEPGLAVADIDTPALVIELDPFERNLDRMADEGMTMTSFYVASPVCSPTRGSVITGRHPNRYGTFAPNYSIRPEEISIASILGQADYVCAHFGKWHQRTRTPEDIGYDESDGFTGNNTLKLVEGFARFLQALAQQVPEAVVAFLTGVGKAYEGTTPEEYEAE